MRRMTSGLRAFVAVVYLFAGQRLRKSDQRTFAKSWAWTLAGDEVRAGFLEGEEHAHDYQKWCRVAPRSVKTAPNPGHAPKPRA